MDRGQVIVHTVKEFLSHLKEEVISYVGDLFCKKIVPIAPTCQHSRVRVGTIPSRKIAQDSIFGIERSPFLREVVEYLALSGRPLEKVSKTE